MRKSKSDEAPAIYGCITLIAILLVIGGSVCLIQKLPVVSYIGGLPGSLAGSVHDIRMALTEKTIHANLATVLLTILLGGFLPCFLVCLYWMRVFKRLKIHYGLKKQEHSKRLSNLTSEIIRATISDPKEARKFAIEQLTGNDESDIILLSRWASEINSRNMQEMSQNLPRQVGGA